MPESLLQTKLYIPPLRPNLVSRPRLIEQFDQGLEQGHRLILISAPAGFGKTTLVSEWAKWKDDGGGSRGNKVAWLSLDEGDDDATRFMAYLVAALRTLRTNIGDGALAMLHSAQPAPSEAILTALLNDIAAVADQFVLVLDDFHLIDADPVEQALTFLLEHMPPQMHLVIVTREDPDLPLARLRVRGQLSELRAADLRFSAPEAAEFLNQAMGLKLTAEEVEALEKRTEGWIAGLQLAALSMRGHADTAGLVRAFTGSHRLVLDYLIEEVWNQQSPEVREFLLRTALLNRLTGALCDAVTGREDGQAMLEQLDRANVFIIPLDNERRWYRYHHLFADLMRRRLQQDLREQIPALHQRASQWYKKNGLPEEAVEHALQAGDFNPAAELIEAYTEALWGRGENRMVQNWLDGLPEAVLLSRPRLSLFQARYQCNRGEVDIAERTLEAAEQAIESSAGRLSKSGTILSDSERTLLVGRAAATRALICSYQGDVSGIIQHASQALTLLPDEDLTWRSLTALTLGNAYGFKGDMTGAYQARLEAAKACEVAGDIYFIVIANLEVAITLREQGRLQRTIEICQQQLRLANEHGLSQSRAVGWLQAVWGETLAELNDLTGAKQRAKQGYELTGRSGDQQMLGWSFMCLIRVLISSGNVAEAEELIQQMEDVALESQMPPWISDQVAAWQARLWLAQGRIENALRWATERGLDPGQQAATMSEYSFFSLFDHVVLARILMAQGRLDEATELLRRLLQAAEAGGRTSKAIEVLVLQALTRAAQGATEQAINILKRALDLAEPEGFARVFVDEGESMEALLRDVKDPRQGMKPYVRELLANFKDKDFQPQADTLIEPLSEREVEILRLISNGLTNQEIADRLYLSLNTVKVHTRNIYGKLNVHTRTQAVALARELGLLPGKYA